MVIQVPALLHLWGKIFCLEYINIHYIPSVISAKRFQVKESWLHIAIISES
jgi:hypothetical protein